MLKIIKNTCSHCKQEYEFKENESLRINHCENCIKEIIGDSVRKENRFVAFLDILGYRSLIDRHIDNIEYIYILNHILNGIKNPHKHEMKYYKLTNCYIQLLSDSLVITAKMEENNVIKLIQSLSWLQLYLLVKGIVIRGGVSLGKHVETNLIMMSQALVEAYDHEQIADYPRIVISKRILSEIQNVKKWDSQNYGFTSSEDFINKYLIKDGCIYYINYLYFLMEKKNIHNLIDVLDSHKDALEWYYVIEKRNNSPDKIIRKIQWMINYHNEFVKQNIPIYNKSKKFDEDINHFLIDTNKISKPNLSTTPFYEFSLDFPFF